MRLSSIGRNVLKKIPAWLAATSIALQAVPSAAQPVAGRDAAGPAERELDAHLVFVRALGDASNEQLGVMKKVASAQPMFDSLSTPAGVRANGTRLRAMLAEAIQGLRRVGQLLARIEAPDTSFAVIKPSSLLAEARDQNAQMVALMGDYDALIAAAQRGDRATVLKTSPKLIAGSYLYMDALRTTMRNRQAAIPRDRSAHHSLEIGIQLYRGMAAAGRAWYNSRLAKQPAAAEATLKRELAAVARTVRDAERAGAASLERELAEIDRLAAGARGKEADRFAAFRAALLERGKLIAMGEEIARWAESGQSVTGSELALQQTPVLMGKLQPLELRLHELGAAEAVAATRAEQR
jgi:hypothetical protein